MALFYRAALLTTCAYAGLTWAVEPALIVMRPDTVSNSVYALSADGFHAVGAFRINGRAMPFAWSFDSGRIDVPGFNYGEFVGVIDDGQTVCGVLLPMGNDWNQAYVYLGTATGPYIPGLSFTASAHYDVHGISGNGSLVYGNVGTVAGFIWRPATNQVISMSTAGFPFPTNVYLTGSAAADAAGTQVVGTISDNSKDSACVWNSAGANFFLPNAAALQWASTNAVGISRNGKYIAGSHQGSDGNINAAIWTDRNTPELLGRVAGSSWSVLNCIADHGRLATGEFPSGTSVDEFVWTREEGMQRAEVFLGAHGAQLPEGWKVYEINGLSADGSVIAGTLYQPTLRYYQGFVAFTNYKPCYADFNLDGGVDGGDVEAFFTKWEAGASDADVNQDGGVEGDDVRVFFEQWEDGGCNS